MLQPKKLMWQLYLSYLLIMGIPIILITWYATDLYSKFYQTRIVEDLQSRAFLIGSQIEEHLTDSSSKSTDSLCKFLAKNVPTRFTVIAPNGKVLGDSEKDPDSMENHGTRPEIITALTGKPGIIKRHSYTLMEDMVYVALPVYKKNGIIAAIVRTSFPVTSIKKVLLTLYTRIAFAVVIMALVAAFISYRVSKGISRPIAEMKSGTKKFAGGDFNVSFGQYGFVEANELAHDLQKMARQLSDRLQIITGQRNELDAVLMSMVEGVIAVDAQERIIIINRAAANLFNIHQARAVGKMIGEAVRNSEVQDFFANTLHAEGPTELEIILPLSSTMETDLNSDRYLQVHGSALFNAKHQTIGALMVVNDISRIRKLENVRKDFVANVSHELRTPLTSMKGYVETLQQGAIDNRDDAVKFLGIIANQVDRLNTIVEDLLSLSKLERDTTNHAIEFKDGRIADVLSAAITACERISKEKNIAIKLVCDPSIVAPIEPSLLEQAIVNLLTNAVKYSEENKEIILSAVATSPKNDIVISVKDQGIGIEKQHLERLFERFYRVDKARSKKLGGTGLGLSIVKHIVMAHGGRVSVESIPKEGSTFHVYLPGSRKI